MQGDEAIVGLTLTELALNILFGSVLLISLHRVPDQATELAALRKQHEDDVLRHEKDTQLLTQTSAALEALKKEREDLRSSMKPSCGEARYGRRKFVFAATVVDGTTYAVDGISYSYPRLLKRFRSDLDEGVRLGCVPRVKVSWKGGIDLKNFNSGLQRLNQEFYTVVISPGDEQ